MATIKMRVTRVSEYDSGPTTMRELQLTSTDRNGQPLNPPEEIAYSNMSVTFVSPNGDEIEHDASVDVNITPSAPEATGASKTQPTKEPKVQ